MVKFTFKGLGEDVRDACYFIKHPSKLNDCLNIASIPEKHPQPSKADLIQDKVIDRLISPITYPINYVIKIVREYKEVARFWN